MSDALLEESAAIYGGLYASAVLVVVLWEALAPRRSLGADLGTRWFTNLGLGAIGMTLTRVVVPITGIAAAVWARERGFGLFNLFNQAAGGWLAVAVSAFILDLTAFGRHVLCHRSQLLWRIHRTHHADPDTDFSTGVRFHPLEAVLVLATQIAVIVAIGAPTLAVFLHETLAMVLAFVSHGNVRYPAWIDRPLRLALVTPDMHRVHHSIIEHESNANFGVVLSWWDFLFGTHTAEPSMGHERMTLGVAERRDPKYLRLRWVLVDPISKA